VSNVPPWLTFLGVIVLVAGGAVLVLVYVRHRFPRPEVAEHNDAIRFAFGVVGVVFAFFTGFVASAMWGEITGADSRARAEGAAAMQMAS
jgi:hypothetical protein